MDTPGHISPRWPPKTSAESKLPQALGHFLNSSDQLDCPDLDQPQLDNDLPLEAGAARRSNDRRDYGEACNDHFRTSCPDLLFLEVGVTLA